MSDDELDLKNDVWLAQAEYRLSKAFIKHGYEPEGKDRPLFDAVYERLSLTVGKATAALVQHYEQRVSPESAPQPPTCVHDQTDYHTYTPRMTGGMPYPCAGPQALQDEGE